MDLGESCIFFQLLSIFESSSNEIPLVSRMKLVDIFYVMPYYPVPRKGTEKLEVKVSLLRRRTLRLDSYFYTNHTFLKEPNFDSFFESPKFKMITKEGNLALEKGLKVRYKSDTKHFPSM